MDVSPRDIPTSENIATVSKLEVRDEKGKAVTFGSLFENQKTMVIFIRHFFCGSCQAYISQLASITPEAFANIGVRLVVIGCGEPDVIPFYKETTGFKGDIYADSSRETFRALDFKVNLEITPKGEEKKSYLPNSRFVNVMASTWRAVTHPKNIGRQGNISQLGGDFVFGPGPQCSFAHRMQHTEDHIEIAELIQLLGLPASAVPVLSTSASGTEGK
ncbi:AhpC/TSA antioxidant enzyme-domain-containing protein [Thelephora terrestris]|uniref:AhpC/TSA antioxidant enzyme-domain-containing protein n=1 Tax=Thelephora terrestris TaxID=56493 RepID=A0A9P6LD22_9AGAM|nr:AhpC/TSA antioxidant enzyme-domain-containing protein [Thelephora terrestris]